MKTKAHAVVTTSLGDVDFAQVTIPEPTSEDVVVNVSHSWISPSIELSFIMSGSLSVKHLVLLQRLDD